MSRSAPAWVVAALFAVGCGHDANDERVEEVAPPAERHPPEPPPAERPHTDPVLVRGERSIMSTTFQATVVDVPEAEARAAIDAAFAEIERLEGVLSEWQPESDISRINAAAGQPAVHVGPDALAVVSAGVEVGRWSDGAFNLSWAALRGLYDFRPDSHRAPTPRELRARLPLIDYRDIVVDEHLSTVQLRRAGMSIGTGGIGKGYALDRASAVLEGRGIASFMLFAGGQVQVHGLRGDRPWRVGIKHPRQDDYFAFVEATEGTISTSGDYEHFFVDDTGRRWHHIIDTHTGLPVEGTLSVTVIAPSGVYGDALSTACFVRGANRCIEMLAHVPGGAEAVIVDSDFHVHTTPDIRSHLHWNMELEDGALPH